LALAPVCAFAHSVPSLRPLDPCPVIQVSKTRPRDQAQDSICQGGVALARCQLQNAGLMPLLFPSYRNGREFNRDPGQQEACKPGLLLARFGVRSLHFLCVNSSFCNRGRVTLISTSVAYLSSNCGGPVLPGFSHFCLADWGY
jgi:hypothetical protein